MTVARLVNVAKCPNMWIVVPLYHSITVAELSMGARAKDWPDRAEIECSRLGADPQGSAQDLALVPGPNSRSPAISRQARQPRSSVQRGKSTGVGHRQRQTLYRSSESQQPGASLHHLEREGRTVCRAKPPFLLFSAEERPKLQHKLHAHHGVLGDCFFPVAAICFSLSRFFLSLSFAVFHSPLVSLPCSERRAVWPEQTGDLACFEHGSRSQGLQCATNRVIS